MICVFFVHMEVKLYDSVGEVIIKSWFCLKRRGKTNTIGRDNTYFLININADKKQNKKRFTS